MIALLVARDLDGVIGHNNDLPWGRSLRSDLRRFKELTTGNAVIMGRRTFESIGRPLPSRQNIVVTSTPVGIDGIQTASDLEVACNLVEAGRETFVIGGARLYREALFAADVVYITLVAGHFDGDVFFPDLSSAMWELAEEEPVSARDRDAYDLSFQTWKRKGAP